ncbi:MAG: helix-turn-helix transcriptional regulator [Clostridia bacterium]|jgi:transcriptional regulator with XRE-family HTH domain|nr:helix-turn-helix transcriptional regulator [Clostridia bacterium]
MIKEKRNSMRYTQEQMAEKLGISLRQYVRIDNEQAFPRRDILKKLIIELELTNEEIGTYIKKLTEYIA